MYKVSVKSGRAGRGGRLRINNSSLFRYHLFESGLRFIPDFYIKAVGLAFSTDRHLFPLPHAFPRSHKLSNVYEA